MTGLGQGTDELCAALYHDEARPDKYLGGAEARMLYDAANRIRELEAENARLTRWASDCTAEIIDALAAAGIDDYEQSALDMVNAIIAENARLRDQRDQARSDMRNHEAWTGYHAVKTENERLRARLATARGLLMRYRNQTPAGYQPHMICAEVDDWMSEEEEQVE